MPKVEVCKVAPIADGAAASVYINGVGLRLYMRSTLTLAKYTKSRRSAEAAAKALQAAGVAAEAKRSAGGVWRVEASIGRLAAGAQELREALAKAVRGAVEARLVPERRARRWLEALEGGRKTTRGYSLVLTKNKALTIRFTSTNPDSIEREAQRLKAMGLVEGLHFTVKMPEGRRAGYVLIRREGLTYAAWLSAQGERLATELIEQILQKAEKRGGDIYEKVKKAVEAGRSIGSLRLSNVRDVEVEVWGRRYRVTVLSWDFEWSARRLRIALLADIDGVESWYAATFYRRVRKITGMAYARARAPGGAEADAERFAALVKALTGKEPYIVEGRRVMLLGRAHLNGFARYAELAEVVMGWLAALWAGVQ